MSKSIFCIRNGIILSAVVPNSTPDFALSKLATSLSKCGRDGCGGGGGGGKGGYAYMTL